MFGQKNILKILVTGEGGVGKTTLLYRYTEDRFVNDTSMTIGLEFFVKHVQYDGKVYILQLWDLGGQDRFRFLHEPFAASAIGGIFVFDLTSSASIERVEEWIGILRKFNSNLPILLVGNKSDHEGDVVIDDLTIKALQTKYFFFEYVKASAKTGVNVTKIFDIFIHNYLNTKKIE